VDILRTGLSVLPDLVGALFGTAPTGAGAASATPAIFFAILWGGPLVVPALAGLLLTALLDGKHGLQELLGRLRRWRAGLAWYAVALLATPLLAALGLAALATTVSPRFVPGPPRDVTLVALAGGVSSLLEEAGCWSAEAGGGAAE
jgi:hypothetical protein